MAQLRIKINNTASDELKNWITIANLPVDKNGNANGNLLTKEEFDQQAINVYAEVDNDSTQASGGVKTTWQDGSSSANTYDTIDEWFEGEYPAPVQGDVNFDDKELKRRKIKTGFILEHRTTSTGTYHLLNYFKPSSQGADSGNWVPLNAIWG